LVRSWDEIEDTGVIVYRWGQYAPASGGPPIALGISPALGWHDPIICHFTRGEKPVWRGQVSILTAGSVPIRFNSDLYSDGVIRYMEDSTICSGGSCGEFATQRMHFGFLYTHPHASNLFGAGPSNPIPVLLRAETLDASMSEDTARRELSRELEDFLQAAKLDELTRSYER